PALATNSNQQASVSHLPRSPEWLDAEMAGSFVGGLVAGGVSAGATPAFPPSSSPGRKPRAPHKANLKERPRKSPRRLPDHPLCALLDCLDTTHEQFFRAQGAGIQPIKRILKQHNIGKWRAKKRPRLKQQHADQRLEWALKYEHWRDEDWRKVIWSDESTVERSKDPRTVWVFRTPNEKWR